MGLGRDATARKAFADTARGLPAGAEPGVSDSEGCGWVWVFAEDFAGRRDSQVGRVVRAERFELPTFWFVARRSIQLSYARMRNPLRLSNGVENAKCFRASKGIDATRLLVW